MKILTVLGTVLVLALPLFASCSALRLGNAVKASSDAKEGEPYNASYQAPATEGWAARYVPRWKSLSNLFPPPTEARKDWDERLRGPNSGRNQPEM